ncbi:3-hydroxyacyl-CoA dehydrogenase family protein [Konateibacter massiliensis]|uniref:3-hydroxyacyl-CoA dehydrogenase family protein n=1 Tax=Konateibacter massiliensis TaxID=2002841 RepID=UPI000C147400|nr:3-hydroxyacyl-CoA dehydrogenase NAD-binding domain-containing protein [Konateibacter massiliensis]
MIQNITVVGAGTMGHAIAGCFALYGYKVSVYESFEAVRNICKEKIKHQYDFLVSEGVLDEAKEQKALDNITLYADLAEAAKDADYVIEAIPEVPELKQELFDSLIQICREDTIFASNTSSIAFSKLTEKLDEKNKKRVMVCHWYNPAHLIPLVELSFFGNMEEARYQEVEDLYRSIEKRPAKVRKDIPGLLANRIQQGIAREVFSLMEMGAADAKDIETALKFGPAFRYATTGQLEVADFGGLDIWCKVGDNLLSDMDRSDHASSLLRDKVEKGELGFKTGRGFFEYPDSDRLKIQNQFNRRLLKQLEVSKSYD